MNLQGPGLSQMQPHDVEVFEQQPEIATDLVWLGLAFEPKTVHCSQEKYSRGNPIFQSVLIRGAVE